MVLLWKLFWNTSPHHHEFNFRGWLATKQSETDTKVPFIILGILGGLYGFIFIKANLAWCRFRKEIEFETQRWFCLFDRFLDNHLKRRCVRVKGHDTATKISLGWTALETWSASSVRSDPACTWHINPHLSKSGTLLTAYFKSLNLKSLKNV